ncbi:MAG: DUF4388 domain-containing protein [Acidobacteriota bacterium]
MIQFQGDLELISFSDVLQFLSGGRKTGALIVEKPEGMTRRIFFDKGEVIAASSSRVEDYIGRILVRRGAVPEAALEEAIKTKPPGVRLGDALVARGLLKPEEIDHFLGEQFRKIIFDTFTWSRGAFRFVAGAKPEGGRVASSMSADNLILEGMRRLDETKLIERKLPAEAAVVVKDGEVTPAHKLSSVDSEVLGLLSRGRALKDLLRMVRADEFEVKKSLFKLIDQGLAKVGPEIAPRSPDTESRLGQELREMIASYNGIFLLIHQSMKLEMGDDVEPPLMHYFREHPLGQSPILQGLTTDGDGGLEGSVLLRNLSAIPREHRRKILAEALNEILNSQIKLVRDSVGPEVATAILEMCSTVLH